MFMNRQHGYPRYLGLAFAACLAVLTACDDGGDAPQAAQAVPPPTVGVMTVGEREIVTERQFVGRLEAFDQVELKAQATGFLQDDLFTDGQMVAAGDLLFQIDPAPYQADVELAKANVAKAAALVEQTRAQLDRSQTLFDQGDVTTAKLETDQASYRQASAELAAAQAQLQQSEIALSYTSILAPIAGRVSASTYSVGALIDSSSGALAVITALDPIYVTFAVSETAMLTVKRERLEQGLDAAFDDDTGANAAVVPSLLLPDGTVRGDGNRRLYRPQRRCAHGHDRAPRRVPEHRRTALARAVRDGRAGRRHADQRDHRASGRGPAGQGRPVRAGDRRPEPGSGTSHHDQR